MALDEIYEGLLFAHQSKSAKTKFIEQDVRPPAFLNMRQK